MLWVMTFWQTKERIKKTKAYKSDGEGRNELMRCIRYGLGIMSRLLTFEIVFVTLNTRFRHHDGTQFCWSRNQAHRIDLLSVALYTNHFVQYIVYCVPPKHRLNPEYSQTNSFRLCEYTRPLAWLAYKRWNMPEQALSVKLSGTIEWTGKQQQLYNNKWIIYIERVERWTVNTSQLSIGKRTSTKHRIEK